MKSRLDKFGEILDSYEGRKYNEFEVVIKNIDQDTSQFYGFTPEAERFRQLYQHQQ